MKRLATRKLKEKGFTLIELLAVIIILAIIALISVPLILNIIEKAKKSAFKDSAYGIIESAKLYYIENIIDNKELGDKVFSYEEEEKELNYSGTKPKGGTVILKSNGKIEMVIHNSKWCAIKGEEEQQVKIIDYDKDICKIDSPIISEGTSLEYMKLGLDSPIPGSYYNIKNQKGTVTCINLSDENKEITNTSELEEGEHNIKCSMNYENKEITSLTRTFKVDGTVPTLTVNNYSGKVGDNVELSKQYTATYGKMKGSTSCTYDGNKITNVNYFKEAGTYMVKCIAKGKNGKSSDEKQMTITLTSPGISGTELVTDNPDVRKDDPDGNPRFVGGNPKNYIEFGNDIYRIIGVFNGQMKIIYWGPKTNVGEFYGNTEFQFDPDASNGGHGEYGYNDWNQAKLKDTLNTEYWSTIPTEYQNMVYQNHVWNISGKTNYDSRNVLYAAERSSTISSVMSGATWKGKVGLMYLSDYGYATNGTSCDTNMNQWYSSGTGDASCYGVSNNWLANTSYHQWTMTLNPNRDYYLYYVHTSGRSINAYAYNFTIRVRPVLYLESNVAITNAEEENVGTSSNPYQLSI